MSLFYSSEGCNNPSYSINLKKATVEQMSNTQIQGIERNITKSVAAIERGIALERLRVNKDFKSIVLDGYFKDEAVRLVHLKAS